MSAKTRLSSVACAATAALVTAVATPARAEPARPSFVTQCNVTDVSLGAETCTYTFRYSQTVETFVVPPTTEPVRITVIGAPGGHSRQFRSRAAEVTGSFPGLGGMPLFVAVGGEGWFDGYNGGGPGGGGGASDVRLGGSDFDHRIIVAGGGGGSGERVEFDPETGGVRFRMVKGGDAGEAGSGAGGAAGTANAGGGGGGHDTARGEPGALGRGGPGRRRRVRRRRGRALRRWWRRRLRRFAVSRLPAGKWRGRFVAGPPGRHLLPERPARRHGGHHGHPLRLVGAALTGALLERVMWPTGRQC